MELHRKIFLVRHGETMWNRERRLQGHKDAPLTRAGIEQAVRIGRALRRHAGDMDDYSLIVSPLGRCRQTAALICEELGYDYRCCLFDERIKEVSWGAWEGLTRDEIEVRFPGEWDARRGLQWEYAPPDGESYAALSRRAAAWLASLPENGTAIAVTHGGTGRAIREVYAGLAAGDTMRLEQPQDAFFLLAGGRIVRIEAC